MRARLACGLLLASVAGCDGSDPDPVVDPAQQHAQALELFKHARETMRTRDAKAAALELEHVVELDPSLAEAWHLLGRHWLFLSDVVFGTPTRDIPALDKAIAAFKKACELQPTNAGYAYWTGFAMSRREDREGATRYLQRAIELDPNRGDAYHELGEVQAKAGDVKAAIATLAIATKLLPNDAPTWFDYGQQLEAEEDVEGAKRAYERAIEVDWTFPGPYSKLATVLQRLGDRDGAAKAAQDYAKWGDYGKRFKAVLDAAKADPKNAAKQLAVAQAYLEAERVDQAVIWIGLSLEADPDFEPAIELLRTIVAKYPNEKAKDLLRRVDGGM